MAGSWSLAETCHFMTSLNLLLLIIKAKLVIANLNHLLTERESPLSPRRLAAGCLRFQVTLVLPMDLSLKSVPADDSDDTLFVVKSV